MQSLDINLTGLAYGGDAFGRDDDGRMVFVPFALPGERVRVETTETHKRWARGRLVEVLEASPERFTPRCPHFAECGGCHYQHMTYPAQLRAKSEILDSQFQRIGGFSQPLVEETVPSPSAWNYRNQVQFSIAPEGQLGFMAAGSERVIPINECHLPLPDVGEIWPRLDIDVASGVQRVTFRVGVEGERMIILHGAGAPEFEMDTDLSASVIWMVEGGQIVLAGEGQIIMQVLDRTFRVSARSFFQVNSELIGELVQRVLESLNVQPGETIFDLYAGVGLFSAFLAEAGAHIIAVEESPQACSDFEFNLEEFDGVELYEAPVETALAAISVKPDAVLVDPPRAGLSLEVLEHLLRHQPPRLVYLSCDAATLARDGQRLRKAGYRLERATPIDMFPQTFHIETLTTWRR
jgi:23S rRNA (uracil1939-C5)-methyltransferase